MSFNGSLNTGFVVHSKNPRIDFILPILGKTILNKTTNNTYEITTNSPTVPTVPVSSGGGSGGGEERPPGGGSVVVPRSDVNTIENPRGDVRGEVRK